MIVVSDPSGIERIGHPGIRELVRQRLIQVSAGEPHSPDRHGQIIVAEPGDAAERLEGACGCALLTDPWDDVPFGHPDFTPSCEVLEEHPDCFELGFVLNDDGFFVALFVPKADGMDPRLLAMCRQFATPANDPAPP